MTKTPPDAEVAELRRNLGKLIRQMIHDEVETPPSDTVSARLRKHLGLEDNGQGLPIHSESLESWEAPNLQLAIDAILADDSVSYELVGLDNEVRHYGDFSISSLMRERGITSGPLEYVNIPIGPDRKLPCLEIGLWLITLPSAPVALLVLTSEEHHGGGGPLRVQAMSPDPDAAQGLLSWIQREIEVHDVYRGQLITVEASRHGKRQVTFLERPTMDRDELILPDGVLDRIEHHILGPTKHREALLAEGQHLSRGLLLWGPPGTGKTHTVKYLTSRLDEATIILLSGSAVGMVGAFGSLARRLAPAVVVLEDVDLVAHRRSHSGNPLLFELMNQMSGHADDADVAFVLTTNMPEALEPALAARPGRVDLAVEIPLPDAESRTRLFNLYSRGMKLNIDGLDEYIERTEGVTASFVRELLRKAAVEAHVRGSDTVTDERLDAALDELLSETSALTRALLGVGREDGGLAERYPVSEEWMHRFPRVDFDVDDD